MIFLFSLFLIIGSVNLLSLILDKIITHSPRAKTVGQMLCTMLNLKSAIIITLIGAVGLTWCALR